MSWDKVASWVTMLKASCVMFTADLQNILCVAGDEEAEARLLPPNKNRSWRRLWNKIIVRQRQIANHQHIYILIYNS